MADSKTSLSDDELTFVCDLVYKEAAIVLDSSKTYLIEARLDSLARRDGFTSNHELVQSIRREKSQLLIGKAIDAMTTNETSFFRDSHPFTSLRNHVIPEILSRKSEQRKLNIWCAACSSGQEPYTVSLMLNEYFPELHDWSVSILATDISDEMLERCREGVFSKLEVNRGLPATMLVKYFEQQGADWRIKDPVRSLIEFKQMNLIGNWPLMPKMDIVFIRNVLIYFDMETKQGIFENVRRAMSPDGYMLLGGAETTLGIDTEFHRLRIDKSTCYTLKEMNLAELAVG